MMTVSWAATTAGAIAAVALGTALAGVGMANAEPNNGGGGGEWDIEAYDNCLQIMRNQDLDGLSQQFLEDSDHYCCNHSGGSWNQAMLKCEAPAGVQPQSPVRPLPPGGIPTAVESFAPAS